MTEWTVTVSVVSDKGDRFAITPKGFHTGNPLFLASQFEDAATEATADVKKAMEAVYGVKPVPATRPKLVPRQHSDHGDGPMAYRGAGCDIPVGTHAGDCIIDLEYGP